MAGLLLSETHLGLRYAPVPPAPTTMYASAAGSAPVQEMRAPMPPPCCYTTREQPQPLVVVACSGRVKKQAFSMIKPVNVEIKLFESATYNYVQFAKKKFKIL